MKCIIAAIVLLLYPSAVLADYTMPVGIPSPGLWGTTDPINSPVPSNPAEWPGGAATGYYYVDSRVIKIHYPIPIV